MGWKRSCGWAFCGALLAVGAATLLAADEKKDPAKEGEEMTAPVVADLGTAFQLVEQGRELKAPESLVTAGGLLLSLSRAEMKDLAADLDGKPIVEAPWEDGKAKVLDVEPKPAPLPDLKKEASSLFTEAEVMALKHKINLSPLIKAVKSRNAAGGPAGTIKGFARTVEPGQTHVLKVKATSDEGTDLAFRATTPLLISVLRTDNDTSLASTLSGAGTLHFQPDHGVKTRGYVVVKKKVVVKKEVIVRRPPPPPPVRWVKKVRVTGYRGLGKGDCPVAIRIHNPSEVAVPYALFSN
jgi:hypothetical protein